MRPSVDKKKKIRAITKETYHQWSAWGFWPASEAGDCCSLGGTAWCLDLGPSSDCLQNLSALTSTHMEETDDIVRCNRSTIDQTSWILMFLSNWTQCTHALNMALTFINHHHMWAHSKRAVALTCNVCVTVIVQASSGYRLTAKQRIAVKVVAEFFQETEDIGDTADRG